MASNINFDTLLQQVVNLFHKKPNNNVAPIAQNVPFKGFQAPIKGSYFNSGDYSPNRATDQRHAKGHKGVDLRASGGTAIYPIASGVVTYVGTDSKGGNVINITHPQDVRAYYAHLGTVTVRAGDKVGPNTVIGTVGDSGNAQGTWPHLHIQVWKNNQLQNPGAFFSVPPYTAPNPKKETAWASPDAKTQAAKFNMQSYKENNQKLANRSDKLLSLAKLYEESLK